MNIKTFQKKLSPTVQSFMEFCVVGDDEIICPYCGKVTNECVDITDVIDSSFLKENLEEDDIPNPQEYFICTDCLEGFFKKIISGLKKHDEESLQKQVRKMAITELEDRGLAHLLPDCPSCGHKLLIQTVMGGHVCINEECENFETVFCYRVRFCNNPSESSYDWYGSVKHGELSNLQLCTSCSSACKCKWDDDETTEEGTIVKVDPKCPRHGDNRIKNPDTISGITE